MAGWAMRNEWAAQARVNKMTDKKRLQEALRAKVRVLESNRQFLRDARKGLLEAGLTEDQWNQKFDEVSDELVATYKELNDL